MYFKIFKRVYKQIKLFHLSKMTHIYSIIIKCNAYKLTSARYWSIVKATYATTTNSIELCNCSFHIQHQANLTTLICNYESIPFCVSIEQRNSFMLPYISWPEFGLSEHCELEH